MRSTNCFVRRLIAGLSLLPFLAAPALAQQGRINVSGTNQPILFLADQLTHNETDDVVTATGSVEITQANRTLLADRVTYNQRTDIVSAQDNVVLLEPTGDVVFADFVELTADFREGVVRQLKVLLRDRSRFAAIGGRRTGGNRTEMVKGVYSPCELCPDRPDRPPLWQLKAEEIVHDEAAKEISYSDVQLELFGVPVFYTPRFSHPDPTVERRTGFLAPTFGLDSDLGFTAEIPYHYVFDSNEDLTVAPIFMTQEPGVLTGEYRRLFRNGSIEAQGSIGVLDRGDENNRVRGHVKASAGLDINENWRARLNLNRASDDTYLRKLDLDNAFALRSEAIAEYFTERNYASLSGLAVQELREDVNNDATPVVLPNLNYNYLSRPSERGFVTVDANALALHRRDGAESRRASITGAWTVPLPTSGGHLFDASVSLRGDVYSVDRVQVGDDTKSGVTGRFVPMAVAGWRYPLVRTDAGGSWVVEPAASVVVAPRKVNPDKIPNEDSQVFELNDLNLFEANRFTGLDRVEGGQRVNYGLGVSWFGLSGPRASAFIGQSLYAGRPDDLPEGSGLDGHVSDLVGRLQVTPYDWLDLLYRFRVDPANLTFHRHELAMRAGEPWLNVTLDYVSLSAEAENTALFDSREQIRALLSSQFTPYWSAFIGTRYDLAENDPLRHQIGLRYADECFTFLTTYTKEFTSDRELEPDERIVFRLIFKNLGGVGFGQSLGG